MDMNKLSKIDGLNEIVADDWIEAMNMYNALRELLEARFNQRYFVEALAIDYDESKEHIFIAVSDMGEHYEDFSVHEKMLEKRANDVYKTRYFKTSSEDALRKLVKKLSKSEFADSISI